MTDKETKINARAFKNILHERGITTLYHFTDRSNLESIIKNGGLYSWKDCSELGIDIPMPGGDLLSRELDERRGLADYVHTSFIKKHPMMFQAQKEGRIKDPVILEIDPEVITWVDTLFSDKNAIRKDANWGQSLNDFVNVHYDIISSTNRFTIEDEDIPFLQAEVMVKNFIPLQFIKNIDSFGIYVLDLNELLSFTHHQIYAQKGNAYEQFCLGSDYYHGTMGHHDVEQAFKWYKASAEQGLDVAQYALATCYLNGIGTEVDHNKAISWYEKAARQGHNDSIFNLAMIYRDGVGVDENPEKVVYWLKEGAELSYSDCQDHLGQCLEYGYGLDANLDEALHWYTVSAEQGNPDAQYHLAIVYHNYYQDFCKSLVWLRKSAEQGQPDAQCVLGMYYKDGVCGETDYEESAYWYKIAAEQGNPDAQYNIGCYYFKGVGVERNLDKAVSWFKKSAKQGNTDAQANLGFCYMTGQGVPENTALGLKWWREAAKQGHQNAIKNLEIYQKNCGN